MSTDLKKVEDRVKERDGGPVKKQRTRNILGITAASIIGIAGITGIGIGVADQFQKAAPITEATIQPLSLAENDLGISVFQNHTKAEAPVVEVVEDYQCIYCKQAQDDVMPMFHEIAESGDIALQYNMVNILEGSTSKTDGVPESSSRPIYAATCADTVGSFMDYHKAVYAHHSLEGKGYSDEVLREKAPKAAGIKDANLTEFQECYDNRETKEVSDKMMNANKEMGRNTTPGFFVNGEKIEKEEFSGIEDTEGIRTLIEKKMQQAEENK